MSHWYLHKSDSGIPPMAIGGLLKSSLHGRQRISLNPPNGSWGIVKVQPPGSVSSDASRSLEGWTLTIPQLPLGGFGRVSARCVGWTLTIHQLPLGGFKEPGFV